MSPPNGKHHGGFYKVTKVSLGVISAASLVLNFIPGLNLVGAVAQGAVTVVETGMDLADGNKKKAAWAFISGALLTAMSFIPELGAAGKLALKGEEMVAAKVGAQAMGAAEGAGIFARIGRAISTPFKWMWRTSKEIPGFKQLHEWVLAPIGKHITGPMLGKLREGEQLMKDGTVNVIKRSKALTGTAKFFGKHHYVAIGTELGLAGAGTVISMKNDSPPAGGPAIPERFKIPVQHRFAHAQEEAAEDVPGTKWRDYENQRKMARTRQQGIPS